MVYTVAAYAAGTYLEPTAGTAAVTLAGATVAATGEVRDTDNYALPFRGLLRRSLPLRRLPLQRLMKQRP